MYAVMTNCTYDGLSVDVARAERLLGASVDRVHFGGSVFCVWGGRVRVSTASPNQAGGAIDSGHHTHIL